MGGQRPARADKAMQVAEQGAGGRCRGGQTREGVDDKEALVAFNNAETMWAFVIVEGSSPHMHS